MKNRSCPHLSVLFFFFFILCPSPSPSSTVIGAEKCIDSKKDGPSALTQQTDKQTNSLTGGSCEAAVGSTGVVFDDNA